MMPTPPTKSRTARRLSGSRCWWCDGRADSSYLRPRSLSDLLSLLELAPSQKRTRHGRHGAAARAVVAAGSHNVKLFTKCQPAAVGFVARGSPREGRHGRRFTAFFTLDSSRRFLQTSSGAARSSMDRGPRLKLDSRDARMGYKAATFLTKCGDGLAQTEAELLDNPVAGQPRSSCSRRTSTHYRGFRRGRSRGRRRSAGGSISSLRSRCSAFWAWRCRGSSGRESASGGSTSPSAGRGTSRTSCSGSASGMRDAHLGDPLPLPAEVAHIDQPRGGGDDHLRGHVRVALPGIHVGRVWVAYWMFPVPNQMGMWPNFRSPLLWDVFAVSVRNRVGPVRTSA